MPRENPIAGFIQQRIQEQFAEDDDQEEKISVYVTAKRKRQLQALAQTLDTNRTQLASDLLEHALHEAVSALPDKWPENVGMVRIVGLTGEHEPTSPRELYMVHLGNEEAAARQGGYEAIVRSSQEEVS